MATLYVAATPIGNLQDWSPRAAETLRNADLIIAEDTRVTMKLCQVFGIRTRMVSCHRHNEESRSGPLADQILMKNETAVLVTDAGTPCISDPGYELVRACRERGIVILPVPGCCAAVAAISISGFNAQEFAFYGFLPRGKKERNEALKRLAGGTSVAVIHESPFRVTELAEAISEILPEAELAVCCDLTKLHEKTIYGTPETVLKELRDNPKAEKGEYCLVLDLHRVQEANRQEKEPELIGQSISLEARLVERMHKGDSLREAQEALWAEGEKKNAVKHAALQLKKWFSE